MESVRKHSKELKPYFNSPESKPVSEPEIASPFEESGPQPISEHDAVSADSTVQSEADDSAIGVANSEAVGTDAQDDFQVPQDFPPIEPDEPSSDYVGDAGTSTPYEQNEPEEPLASDAFDSNPPQDNQAELGFSPESLESEDSSLSEPVIDSEIDEPSFERLDTDMVNMIDGIFGDENDNPFAQKPDEDHSASISESDLETPAFNETVEQETAEVDAGFSAPFEESYDTDRFLDSIGTFDGTLAEPNSEPNLEEAASMGVSLGRDSTISSYEPNSIPSHSNDSDSARATDSTLTSAPAASASFPSAILPAADDRDSEDDDLGFSMHSDASEDSEMDTGPDYPVDGPDYPVVDGPDYPVDGPDYPVDGPDYPEDDHGFEDFESYQQTMNRRVRLIIAAVLVIVTPWYTSSIPPFLSLQPCSTSKGRRKEAQTLQPQRLRVVRRRWTPMVTLKTPPQKSRQRLRETVKPLKNIEESASGEGAVEGDAVTGLSDTNGESTKGPIEPSEPPNRVRPPNLKPRRLTFKICRRLPKPNPLLKTGPILKSKAMRLRQLWAQKRPLRSIRRSKKIPLLTLLK